MDNPFYTHPSQTAPYCGAGRLPTAEDQGTTRFSPTPAMRDDDTLRAAFCDLHGSRLHGFALLVSLGDARRAAQATGDALAVGSRHAAELRHPERAAAWLRARVLGRLRNPTVFPGSPSSAARRAALARLGVDETTFSRLASLSPVDRAAVTATIVEGFQPIDVETILGNASSATLRAVARANQRFLAAGARADDADAEPAGDLSRRVNDVTERALASTRPRRRSL